MASILSQQRDHKEILRREATMKYVLVTAAKNERRYIESTIGSIINQTHKPDRWLIVSDGSTDGMDNIVARYADQNAFIQLLSLGTAGKRDFASKAFALNRGVSMLCQLPFEFIGCLDADIVLEPDYYEKIILLFAKDALLGVAGGSIYESNGVSYVARPENRSWSVPGAIQMFRENCFRQLGGYVPIKYGGEDTVLEVRARMLGFSVKSFSHPIAYHLRRTGDSNRPLLYNFRLGLQNYEIGYHPLYELLKCFSKVLYAPLFLASMSQFVGFLFAKIAHRKRAVPNDQIAFMRKEQLARMRKMLLKMSRSAIE